MAVVSEQTAAHLAGMPGKSRISFREDLNDTRHCDEDGFESDFSSSDEEDEEDDDDDDDLSDPASNGDRALKYRKSLTMLNQLAGVAESPEENEVPKASREHLLAAKKSIDDLTAWVRARGADAVTIHLMFGRSNSSPTHSLVHLVTVGQRSRSRRQ